MRRPAHLALLALLAGAPAAVVSGQTPTPTPTPEPGPGGAPEQQRQALDQAPDDGAHLVLRLQEGWQDNANRSETLAVDDFIARLGVKAGYGWSGTRSHLRLDGDATALRYHQLDQLNRTTWGATGAWRYQAKESLGVRAGASFSDAYTRDLPLEAEQGVLLPLAQAHDWHLQAGLDAKLDPSSELTFDANWRSVSFDTDLLRNGKTLQLKPIYTRHLGTQDSVTGNYVYLRSDTARGNGTSHALFAGWDRQLRKETSLHVALGALLLRDEASQGSAFEPAWQLGLTRETPLTSFTAAFVRTVDHVYGLGRERLSDEASVRLGRRLRKELWLNFYAGYARSRDPQDPAFKFDTTTLRAGLERAIGRYLRLVGGYVFLDRSAVSGLNQLRNNRLEVALVYARRWE